MYNLLSFQKTAQEKLSDIFIKTWKDGNRNTPVVLKAPTGSGKTLITSSFINGLNKLPNWDQDKAFIWVTFHEDLAIQSKTKFAEYFANNLENELLTTKDISRGKLFENDILFLNWEKVTSKKAEGRVLLRPDDALMRKESGYYFEDYIENTHTDGREIILIIDEAHSHVDTALAQKVIQKINPKVTIHVSATPSGSLELDAYRNGTMIEIQRADVVAEGLIKEKIVTQTEEELESVNVQDLDEALLELGIRKYEQLKLEYKKLNKNINPLIMIQLPNDDSRLVELGHPTKETITLDYLKRRGFKDSQIALWFDNKKVNYDESIKQNNNEVSFLIFKQAAGTGWDCPRAQVLVMFREISSTTFYIQTIGRILRTVEPNKQQDYLNSPLMRTGFLFTNYKRDELRKQNEYRNANMDDVVILRKYGVRNVSMDSDFIPHIDYGNLGDATQFQISFIDSMNAWLGVENGVLGQGAKNLQLHNIELNPNVTYGIIAGAQFSDFDTISTDFANLGSDVDVAMSRSDIEKAFNLACYDFLHEQSEYDAKIGNVSRSWSPFKSSLRVWLNLILPEAENNSDYLYRLVLNDFSKGSNSVLKPAFTKALKDYYPIKQAIIEAKDEVAHPKFEFKILEEYAYNDEYEEVPQNLCVLEKYMMKSDYLGRMNELAFVHHLEGMENVEWWFKNHDYGKEYYAINYTSKSGKGQKLFYPDWIVMFKDGTIGIFDTKAGNTAEDTDGRAEALAYKLEELGGNYVGGIVVKENGLWYCNRSKRYEYAQGKLSPDWILLN